MQLFPVACVIAALVMASGRPTASPPTAANPSATLTTTTASDRSAQASTPKAGRTVELTAGDTMKYDKTEITARPGETLHVVLKSTATLPKIAMGHNFVLLKAGTDPVAFNAAAVNARETDFIPPSMKTAVIANTRLAGPGDTVETTLTVPAKAGKYEYLCSFPGHFALGMRGTLTVE